MEFQFSDKIKTLKPSAIREIFKFTQDPAVIPFSAGNPAPESFPVAEMAKISAYLFENCPAAALQYSLTEGYTPLRDKIKARNEERFFPNRTFNDTIIVSGGQQGIELSCKILCNEGDTVLCENPSFIGALNAFRSYNVNLKGIQLEDDGINIEALEKALKTEKNVKMLYIIPTFQNPSGLTTSLEKRKAVYELCKKHNVIIFEDNPYGELRFKGKDVPTIKSMDTEGIVIYAGTFSKILSAGMRVGFMTAHRDIIQKAVVAKQISDVHTNIFFQMLVDKYIQDYDLDAHIKEIRALYEKKCGLMLEAIDKYFDKRVKTTRPEGGIFLWCEMPEETDIMALTRKGLDQKVAIVPGDTFMANPSDKCSAFRMNYSTPSEEQIVRGIEVLSHVIKEML